MPKRDKGSVYLLDVSFFTFRAYYALPPLNTDAGLPTNAVHGVATMLERLIKLEHPAYLAAAFDSPGKTFRSDIYPEYKANRDEPDEDLQRQFPYVRRLVEAMSICCLADPTYEADDIVATLAKRAAGEGHDVVIVSGDKDLMQCVNERVTLFDPVRNKRVGIDGVLEKFGVEPAAVTDVQGLMGDSTDNIPGVRGVGPKTATALIQHFGDIDNLYARLDEIETLKIRGAAGVRKKVEAGEDLARLSKRLATVCVDVPTDCSVADMAFESLHTTELLELAEELEMGRLANRLRELVGATDDAGGTDSEPSAADAAAPKAKARAVAAGLDADWRALGAGELVVLRCEDQSGGPIVAFDDGERRVAVEGEEAAAALSALHEKGASFSGHDVKGLCRDFGVTIGEEGLDLGVASYLYDPEAGSHDAAGVCERFLGEAVADPLADLSQALDQVVRSVPVLRAALDDHKQTELYAELERPLVSVLAAIEARGILLDTKLLEGLSNDFESRMSELVGKVYSAAGEEFNILSPVQLRRILFEKLELPTKGIKKTKTGLSTDTDSLHALAPLHELPAMVLEYRGLSKLKSTYVDALPRLVDERSRIHTRLNQTVAATGRLSSKDPNLQNIPIRSEDGGKIRRAFVAGEGNVLISADYNQIELRVLADLARDDALIEAFAQGRDIHSATASEVFGVALEEVSADQRRASKVINYGIIYGMGPVRMSRELGITRSEASSYIEAYFERYPGVRRFYAEMLDHARAEGYVETRFGRRRYLPDIHSDHGGRRQAAERVASNTPIQGSAADIIKRAMVRLSRSLDASGLDAVMILQIHDELLLESPAEQLDPVVDLTREAMEGAAELAVPIVVDVGSGPNWAIAH